MGDIRRPTTVLPVVGTGERPQGILRISREGMPTAFQLLEALVTVRVGIGHEQVRSKNSPLVAPDPGASSMPLEWDQRDDRGRLAGDVQDRVHVTPVDGLKQPARLCSGDGGQLHPSNPGLLPHLRHDR